MKHHTRIAIPCLILVALITTRAASADTERVDVSEASQPQQRFSLTMSPLHLVISTIELTGEYALSDKQSIAGIVGIGAIDGVNLFEAGGQYRRYLIGSFRHGVAIGGEMLAVSGIADVDGDVESAGGIAVGPFLGYKYAAGFGLTFDVALGAHYLFVTDGDDSLSEVSPMLNLNMGWTF